MNDARPLDRIDLRILSTLQDDGRITNKELAEKVNLSPSACHHRVQKLIADEWILGFTGHINIEKLNAPVQCIATISLNTHAPDAFQTLERHVHALPEALEAFTVSGNCDFIIRFACPHMSQYMEITNQLIQECPEISNISTHVVMKHCKSFRGFPLSGLK